MLPYTFYQFSLGDSTASIQNATDLAANSGLLIPALLGFGIPFFVSLLALKRYPLLSRWAWLMLAATIGVAFCLHLKLHFYQPTYLIAALPLYLIILAAGLWLLRRSFLLPLSLLLILPLLGFSLNNYYFNPHFAKENWRGVAAHLQEEANPEDIILFHKSWLKTPFDYYYSGTTAQMALPDNLIPDKAPEMKELKGSLSVHPAIWLIQAHTYHTGSYYRELLGQWFLEQDCKIFQTGRAITVCRFVPQQKVTE
jgi:hypothetical protein